jgi:hypothetical protein
MSRELAARKLRSQPEPTITADMIRGAVVDVSTAAGEIEEEALAVGVCRRCGEALGDSRRFRSARSRSLSE